MNGAPAVAAALPIDIHDVETIVRAVKTPHHVNKAQTRVRAAAFRPQAGQTAVSVIRQLMGDHFCKDKGGEICGPEYIGLSAITGYEIRKPGSLLVDHRADFLGHAHIDHQLPAVQKDEPPPPALKQQLDARCKQLADATVFYSDPSPSVPGWAGPPLQLASPLPAPAASPANPPP